GRAEADYEEHAEGSSEWRCDRRRCCLSGWVYRDYASDDALEPDVLRRRSVALLRREHAGRRATNVDVRVAQRHAAVCFETGEQGFPERHRERSAFEGRREYLRG